MKHSVSLDGALTDEQRSKFKQIFNQLVGYSGNYSSHGIYLDDLVFDCSTFIKDIQRLEIAEPKSDTEKSEMNGKIMESLILISNFLNRLNADTDLTQGLNLGLEMGAYNDKGINLYERLKSLQSDYSEKDITSFVCYLNEVYKYPGFGFINDIHSAVVLALGALYDKNKSLFVRGVNERTVTHKMAEILQKMFPGYYVDCEFNRFFIEDDGSYTKRIGIPVKKIDNTDTSARSVYPDIIIHNREPGGGLLVIEVKKNKQNISYDEKKLFAFTSESSEIKYRYGLLLILGDDFFDAQFKYFVNGGPINLEVQDKKEEDALDEAYSEYCETEQKMERTHKTASEMGEKGQGKYETCDVCGEEYEASNANQHVHDYQD